MSDDEAIRRTESDIARHKDDIEKVLGPDYKESDRYKQLVAEVTRGRSIVFAMLDLKGL